MSFTSIVQICPCPFWEAFLICPLLSSIPVCQTCLPLCCLPAYVILQQKEKGIFPFCALSGQWWKHDEMSVRKLHARTHTHITHTFNPFLNLTHPNSHIHSFKSKCFHRTTLYQWLLLCYPWKFSHEKKYVNFKKVNPLKCEHKMGWTHCVHCYNSFTTDLSKSAPRISVCSVDGLPSPILKMFSMMETSVAVVSWPQNAIQSLTTSPAPITSLPLFTVPALKERGTLCSLFLP